MEIGNIDDGLKTGSSQNMEALKNMEEDQTHRDIKMRSQTVEVCCIFNIAGPSSVTKR